MNYKKLTKRRVTIYRIIISVLVLRVVAAVTFVTVLTPFAVHKTVNVKGGVICWSITSSKSVPGKVTKRDASCMRRYDDCFTKGHLVINVDAFSSIPGSDKLVWQTVIRNRY